MKIGKNKAQSFLEYAVLIAIAAAALVAMRIYFVRSVQEKYRQSADVFGEGEQYAKGATQVTEYASSTDISSSSGSQDVCANIQGNVAGLEKDIHGYDVTEPGEPPQVVHHSGLLERAASFEAQAAQMRQQAQVSSDAGFGDAGPQEAQLIKMAADFENQARAYREEAADKQDEIDQLKAEYADCF